MERLAMSIKEENEITVKVLCSNEELLARLRGRGFSEGRKFSMDDYYMVPNSLNTDELTTREILSRAVIVRHIVVEGGEIAQKITFKKKVFDEKGEILSQAAINCDVLDYESAIRLFTELDYRVIMNIKENDVIYCKDKLELALKFVDNGDTLIEVETNDTYKTIPELKNLVKAIELPIEKDNYFVKKAENALNKILGREN